MMLIAIVLIITTVFTSSGCMNKQASNPMEEFSEYIELLKQGASNELSLTIYSLSPYIFTQWPIRERELINKEYEYKVTVNGWRLEENIDLLSKLASTTLKTIEQESYVYARLYYVFENKNRRKILSVCMWGGSNVILVNGRMVEEKDIFYEVVIPFLPVDAAEEWEKYRKNVIAN